MGDLRWYKRDPRAALKGMSILTLEERGAYNTILDLIYCHDGELDDEPRYICQQLGCNVRTWTRIRARLINLEKLYLHGGKLRNERADGEVLSALKRIQRQAEGGLKSVEIQRERRKFRQTLEVVSPQNVSRVGDFNRLRPSTFQTPTPTKR